MKKISILFMLLTSYIFSNINAVVSILPQQTFLKAIGGDKVHITLMVQPGNSPHTYEPKPSQMKSIAEADLYLSINVEFEDLWLSKFIDLNPKMRVINIAESTHKIPMYSNTDADKSHTTHAHHHKRDDPHIWTAPRNVKIIAENIYNALVTLDAKNKKYYKDNLEVFLEMVANTDEQISKILSTLHGSRTFMVFHPSWGHFAKAYNLEQIAVEIEGKSPKPKALIQIINEAKKEKVKAIFAQPEFSDKAAQIIAKELQIPVFKVSPLAPNWSENLLGIAKAIAGQK